MSEPLKNGFVIELSRTTTHVHIETPVGRCRYPAWWGDGYDRPPMELVEQFRDLVKSLGKNSIVSQFIKARQVERVRDLSLDEFLWLYLLVQESAQSQSPPPTQSESVPQA